MTVVDVQRDTDALTLTIVSELDATAERLWQIWADPRQLERWWGPPTHPATVVDHDLSPGGRVSYYMTGPDGEKYAGWWRVDVVEPPRLLVFTDGFSDDDGDPNDELPTTVTEVRLEPAGSDRTRMTLVSRFESPEAMEQILAMGAEEGMTLSLGRIDELLAGTPDRSREV